MDFKVQVEGLDALIDAMTAAGANVHPLINKAVQASILHVQVLAREKAPHRTGTLQRSILPETHDMYSELKVNEKYGLWIEEGTGPHDIYPKNKKALMWPGAPHPMRVVHHPGTAAHPFFQPAIEESEEFMQQQFDAVYTTLARNIAARSA